MERYPETKWPNLLRHLGRNWSQGEHIAIVGPTGVGKTTLLSQILPIRTYCALLVTKVHDDTLKNEFPDFYKIDKWPPKLHQNKVMVWPQAQKTIRETITHQRNTFKDALDRIFHERNWCVVFDEQHFVCKKLGLSIENEMFLHQGRSSGISVVNGCQRPAWVPLATYPDSTHAFVWRTTLAEDRRRLADLGGIDRRDFERNMLRLGKHDFIYVDTRRGHAYKGKVEL